MSSGSDHQSLIRSASAMHADRAPKNLLSIGQFEYDIVYFIARIDAAGAEWGPVLAEEDYEWLQLAKSWLIENQVIVQNAAKIRLEWSRLRLGLTQQRQHSGPVQKTHSKLLSAVPYAQESPVPIKYRKHDFCDVEYDQTILAEMEEEDLRKVRKNVAACSIGPLKNITKIAPANVSFKIENPEQGYTDIRNEMADDATDDLPGKIPFWATKATRCPDQSRPLNLIPIIDERVPSNTHVAGRGHWNCTRFLCYNQYTDAFEFVVYTRKVDWSNQDSIAALLIWREELCRSDDEWMRSQNAHRHEERSDCKGEPHRDDVHDNHLNMAMAHLKYRIQTRSYPDDENDRALWWKDAVDDDQEPAHNVWDSPLRHDHAAATNALLNAAIVPPLGYLGSLKDLQKCGKAEYLLTKAEHRQIEMSEEAHQMIAQEHDRAWDEPSETGIDDTDL